MQHLGASPNLSLGHPQILAYTVKNLLNKKMSAGLTKINRKKMFLQLCKNIFYNCVQTSLV